MANPNKPYGLLLLDTEGKEYRVRRYPKTGAAIFCGDALMQDATGAVKVTTGAVALIGVAAESASASATTVAVVDDPEAIYSIQASADLQQADIFLNADIVATSGDTLLNRSKMALNSAAMDTTATRPLKVLGKTSDIDNAYGSYCKVVVAINNALLKGGTGTTGV